MKKRFKKGESKYPELNNKNWLHQKYWIEWLSLKKIANDFGCSVQAIVNAFKRNGVKTRTTSEAKKGNKNNLGHKHSEETKRRLRDANTKYSYAQRKMNRNISRLINHALDGTKAGRHWETLVGYTLGELMHTLEKEFRDGMTWDNHGALWHIDHIIPLARFKYDSPEDPEFKKAWALGNLQPLLVAENLKKHTKFMFF